MENWDSISHEIILNNGPHSKITRATIKKGSGIYIVEGIKLKFLLIWLHNEMYQEVNNLINTLHMGYSIKYNSKGEELPANKVNGLIADGAKETDASFKDNLVCVVQFADYQQANFVYNELDFAFYNSPDDKKPKFWLVYEHAKKVSGYL